MKRAFMSVTAAFLLAAASGCSDFERIDFQYSADLPLDIRLTYEEIRLPAGVAVTTIARPMGGDSPMARETKVELASADPSVLGVAFALPNELGASGGSAGWTFVLYAVKAGSTEVTVRVDGEMQGTIPAMILPQ